MSDGFAPWTGARRTLLTFDEEEPGLRHCFTGPVADRLADVTARYDPDSGCSPTTPPTKSIATRTMTSPSRDL